MPDFLMRHYIEGPTEDDERYLKRMDLLESARLDTSLDSSLDNEAGMPAEVETDPIERSVDTIISELNQSINNGEESSVSELVSELAAKFVVEQAGATPIDDVDFVLTENGLPVETAVSVAETMRSIELELERVMNEVVTVTNDTLAPKLFQLAEEQRHPISFFYASDGNNGYDNTRMTDEYSAYDKEVTAIVAQIENPEVRQLVVNRTNSLLKTIIARANQHFRETADNIAASTRSKNDEGVDSNRPEVNRRISQNEVDGGEVMVQPAVLMFGNYLEELYTKSDSAEEVIAIFQAEFGREMETRFASAPQSARLYIRSEEFKGMLLALTLFNKQYRLAGITDEEQVKAVCETDTRAMLQVVLKYTEPKSDSPRRGRSTTRRR
jgi:hypothetical protein